MQSSGWILEHQVLGFHRRDAEVAEGRGGFYSAVPLRSLRLCGESSTICPAGQGPRTTDHGRQPNPQSAIRNPQLRRSAIRNPQSGSGFTLIEIIVVLVIIAVAMAVVMPSMRTGLAGMRLEAKGRDLVTLCRTARTLAVGEQRVYRIAVQKDRSSIFLADAYHEKVRDFELTGEIKVSSVKYEGEESRDPAVYISFYPNGRADDAELVLENDRGRKVTVKTDVITGSAKLTIPKEQRG